MSMRLSEHAQVIPLTTLAGVQDNIFLHDIGGTTAETAWKSMKNYARGMAFVEIGTTWNAADDLDHCRIEADILGDGGSITEVTTDASGGDYDTDNPGDASTDFVIIEFRAEDLPDNKPYVRLKIGEDGNSGVDWAGGFLILYGYAYPQEEVQGAAAVGSKVYVQPETWPEC